MTGTVLLHQSFFLTTNFDIYTSSFDNMRPYIIISQVLLILWLSMLLLSCEKKSQFEILNNLDKLPVIEGEQILKDHSLGYTEFIKLIGDKVVVSNMDGLYFNTAIDLAEKEPDVNWGLKGNGPNEFLNMGTITYNNRDSILYIHDTVSRKAVYYKVNPDSIALSAQNLVKTIDLKTSNVRDTQPSKYGLVTNYVTDGKMFTSIREDGEVSYAFGEYPGDKTGIEDPIVFFMGHQTLICTNPQGDKLVVAGRTADWVSFYELKNDGAILIKDYYGGESSVDIGEEGTGDNRTVSMNATPETKICFYELNSSENYLYATYVGLTREDIRNANSNGDQFNFYILRYDWDGNFVDGYIFTDKMMSLTVDPDDTFIIAVIQDDNDDCIIKQYPLN